MHASDDSPCHSSAKPPPLEGLSPSHGAFQGHAAHLAEWSATLRPTGSSSTCIPDGVSTFFHAASRRTARHEQRLSGVACKPWLEARLGTAPRLASSRTAASPDTVRALRRARPYPLARQRR